MQGPGDPAPGYYVSTTSLHDANLPVTDPRRYVDSEQVPYLALPEPFVAALGCTPIPSREERRKAEQTATASA